MGTHEATGQTRKRRPNYSLSFKRQLVERACAENVLFARLALEHSLNADMVFKCRRQLRAGLLSDTTAFLPVAMALLRCRLPHNLLPTRPRARPSNQRTALSGSTDEAHKAFLKKLLRHLREHGIKSSYRTAREIDGTKGEHLHIAMCVQGQGGPNPDHILNRKQTQWLVQASDAMGIKVYLNAPGNKSLHGDSANYMSLPKSNPAKIKDARLWLSYLYKQRGKPEAGEVYSSSLG